MSDKNERSNIELYPPITTRRDEPMIIDNELSSETKSPINNECIKCNDNDESNYVDTDSDEYESDPNMPDKNTLSNCLIMTSDLWISFTTF